MKYINEFIKYKESKGEKAIYRVNDNCGNTYYGEDYVNWLEEQLRIHDVVGRSEQSCKHPDSCAMGYYHQIGDYYCSKCQKTGLRD